MTSIGTGAAATAGGGRSRGDGGAGALDSGVGGRGGGFGDEDAGAPLEIGGAPRIAGVGGASSSLLGGAGGPERGVLDGGPGGGGACREAPGVGGGGAIGGARRGPPFRAGGGGGLERGGLGRAESARAASDRGSGEREGTGRGGALGRDSSGGSLLGGSLLGGSEPGEDPEGAACFGPDPGGSRPEGEFERFEERGFFVAFSVMSTRAQAAYSFFFGFQARAYRVGRTNHVPAKSGSTSAIDPKRFRPLTLRMGSCYQTRAVRPPADLLIFRNVRAIDPSSGLDAVTDLVIERGIITRIGADAGREWADRETSRVISGEGKWLVPAFVDLHAHLREPGQEYKEDVHSGLRAAAAGGYAHVCVMPNTKPVNDTRAVTELMLARARELDGTTLHPIAAITKGQKGQELTEMADLRDAGAIGVSDDGVCVMSAAVMRQALQYARNFDMPVIQHAEDHDLTAGATMHEGAVSAKLGLRGWPRVAEDIIIARDVLLAEYVGARYHAAHLSTEGAARIIREAKSRNLPVTAEVTPHHLLLTDAAVVGYDTACRVNPPLREEQDVAALRRALADGTIDAIATDHAPHSRLEKDVEFAAASPGMMGLELCFGLLVQLVGRDGLTLGRLLDAMSTAPAKVAGIDPPRLREGARAELTLIDPEARWIPAERRLQTKSLNSPFLKSELGAKVLLTMAHGAIVFEDAGEAS